MSTSDHPAQSAQPRFLLVSVGNTRSRVGVGVFEASVGERAQVHRARSVPNDAIDAQILLAPLHEHAPSDAPPVPAIIAGVNAPIEDTVVKTLEAADGLAGVLRVGRDVPIPLSHRLRDASTLGQDRALNAVAAFGLARQACVVIDVGTAITVDFVDGEGAFIGGAIAPGLDLMCDALHEHTHALPRIDPRTNEPSPETQSVVEAENEGVLGDDTVSAITVGVRAAAIGLAHHLIDRYAQFYGAYPKIIATGGDAQRLFQHDELVEHIAPDLTLLGIAEAFRKLHDDDAGGDDEGPESAQRPPDGPPDHPMFDDAPDTPRFMPGS